MMNLISRFSSELGYFEIIGNKKKKSNFDWLCFETDNELQNANNKIKSKNLDAIVLNSLNDKGAGFGYDTNKVTYINNKGTVKNFKLKSKDEVSIDILDQLITDFHEKFRFLLICLVFNFLFLNNLVVTLLLILSP